MPDGALLPASRLTASDIARSGLRAEVVVLSGCATGDGSELRGEGAAGAGVPQLVRRFRITGVVDDVGAVDAKLVEGAG